MRASSLMRRAVGAGAALLLAASAFAPIVALGTDGEPVPAPDVPATEGQPAESKSDITLYVLDECYKTEACDGAAHTGWDRYYLGLGSVVAIGSDADYQGLNIHSSDPTVAVVNYVDANKNGHMDPEDQIEIIGAKAGSATVTVSSSNATTDPNVISVAVKATTFEQLSAEDQAVDMHTEDVYRIYAQVGDQWGGMMDDWVVMTDEMWDQDMPSIVNKTFDVFKVGEKYMMGNGKYYTFYGWNWVMDGTPDADYFTETSMGNSYTGKSQRYHDYVISARWNPSTTTGMWSPWDSTGNALLPHKISNGTMTFTGLEQELGSWYQLTLDLGEGITTGGTVAGGSEWAMTIDASQLPTTDPAYNEAGFAKGPYWVRGNNNGAASHIYIDIPEGKSISYELVPASAGTVTRIQGGPILAVQLSAPATLKVRTSDATVVTNKDGASFSHVVKDAEDDMLWAGLTLNTTWLSGEKAQDAGKKVNTAVDNVKSMYVYDINLTDWEGKLFQIPEGDSVTVTLPIPEGMDAEGLHVFHVADDGTVTDMGAVADADARTVSFTTTHFSTFVLAQLPVEKPAGDQGNTTKPAGEKTDGSDAKKDPAAVPAAGDPGSVAAAVAGVAGLAALAGAHVTRRRG